MAPQRATSAAGLLGGLAAVCLSEKFVRVEILKTHIFEWDFECTEAILHR